MEYLKLYQNPQLTKEELEYEFIKATALILWYAKANSEVYAFVLEYLIDGFQKFDFQKMIDFIAEVIEPDKLCHN